MFILFFLSFVFYRIDLLLNDNVLSANLPSTLSKLAFLTYLDLSGNKFEGSVPPSICESGLSFINFSGNRFSGYVPETCTKNNASPAEALPITDAPIFSSQARGHGLPKSVSGVLISATLVIILLVLICLLAGKKLNPKTKHLDEEGKGKLVMAVETDSSDELLGKKWKEPLSINIATFQHSLTRIHLSDILSSTDNFSKTYVVVSTCAAIASILTGVLAGMFALGEHLPSAPGARLFVLLGWLCIIAGVILLVSSSRLVRHLP